MRVVGVDVGEREWRVAVGERRLGAVRLLGLERIPRQGDAFPAALAGRVLTALPAALAAHRVLVLPFRERRRLARTVPLELLGQLPVEPEHPVVAFTPLGAVPGGTAVLAAVARRADLDAHAAGLPPATVALAPLPLWSLVPAALGDAAVVLADGARSALSVRRDGRVAGLRALGAHASEPAALAAEVRWTLAALGGTPPALVVAGADAGPALEAALAGATGVRPLGIAAVAGLDLAPADTVAACALAAGLIVAAPALTFGDAVGPAGSLRRAGTLAAAALALAVLDLGLVHHGLTRRDAALTAAIHREAAAALPSARLVAPRAELAAALAARGRRGAARASGLGVLRELSTRVPASLRLDLDELAVDGDGVRLHGRAESFDAVDALRRALAASPLLADVTADDTRTTVDGRRVEFRLHAARRPGGGTSS